MKEDYVWIDEKFQVTKDSVLRETKGWDGNQETGF